MEGAFGGFRIVIKQCYCVGGSYPYLFSVKSCWNRHDFRHKSNGTGTKEATKSTHILTQNCNVWLSASPRDGDESGARGICYGSVATFLRYRRMRRER